MSIGIVMVNSNLETDYSGIDDVLRFADFCCDWFGSHDVTADSTVEQFYLPPLPKLEDQRDTLVQLAARTPLYHENEYRLRMLNQAIMFGRNNRYSTYYHITW